MSVREPRPDIGVIAALAIHDMDICRDLMGDIDPEEIDAFSLPSELEGIEDHAVIHMRFPSGTCKNPLGPSAQITVSWRSRVRGKVRELRIIGRDASLHIDYLDHTGIWLHRHPNNIRGPEWGGFGAAPRERIEISDGEPSLTAELRAFAAASEARSEGHSIESLNLLAPGSIGVIGMRLVEAALDATKD